LQYISAGLERLILFLYPSFVVLLSAAFFGKPLGGKEIFALLLSYGGIGLVFFNALSFESGNLLLGVAFVFASTLCYAGFLIGAGHNIVKIGAIPFTAYAMLVASAAILTQFFLTHPPQALLVPLDVYKLSFLMAIFSTVLPVFMLMVAIRLIGSSHTALIGSIGPIFTLVLASVVLNEEMSNLQVGGAILVLIGVLSLSRKK
jgi:drug/metabolite transporter (DMT)-like permease